MSSRRGECTPRPPRSALGASRRGLKAPAITPKVVGMMPSSREHSDFPRASAATCQSQMRSYALGIASIVSGVLVLQLKKPRAELRSKARPTLPPVQIPIQIPIQIHRPPSPSPSTLALGSPSSPH